MSKLILASSSPRRQAMFNDLGLVYQVVSPHVDETPLKGEKPVDYVKRIAQAKALKIAKENTGHVIVAADTTVAVGRHILGKPESADEAAKMLALMSGRRHKVLTAVCVVNEQGECLEAFTQTVVKFKPLSSVDIQKHVTNNLNWQGKAGGYGIQTTAGGALIRTVQGSYTGVVGMPILEVIHLLRRCNIDV